MLVEKFLADNGLRLDDMDYYAAAVDKEDYKILAGGGFKEGVIKCVAVSDDLRGTGVSQQLISHLISEINSSGNDSVKVFTKPSNIDIFKSLGFKVIGESSNALFMENSLNGISKYTKYLSSLRRDGKNGIIVMNANPFTNGHKFLVENASKQVDNLYVIVVEEDKSLFTSEERFKMVKSGCQHLNNVIVCHGSSYIISAATFPSYFIKKADDASRAQIEIDLDVMMRHIIPALNAKIRFVGSEPCDKLTYSYNEAMKKFLPEHNVDVVEFSRLDCDGNIISASSVRNLLFQNRLIEVIKLVPTTSVPYLVAWCACNSLKQELDLTPKPGLVDLIDNGSHYDMNHDIMFESINALRPFFVDLAVNAYNSSLLEVETIKQIGINAENAMLQATRGVNTHRGALFSMGLAIVSACHVLACDDTDNFIESWSKTISSISSKMQGGHDTHGANIKSKYNIKGALEIAQSGYHELVNVWLPFFAEHKDDEYVKTKTLLLIMSTLDDTNVIYRAGYDLAQQVKQESNHLLKHFDVEDLKQMNRRFIDANISPGGAADMLSLTFFLYNFINKYN